MKLRAGDWVEVRSKAQILATLDGRGRLDHLPFMPEMWQYCGKRFQVWKRAHKTCDTVNRTGGRRVSSAIHLQELRCDGAAHGGCEAACLLFWKDAWLKRVAGPEEPAPIVPAPATHRDSGCTEEQVSAATRASSGEADPTYVCQATLLPAYTAPLKWSDLRQYVEDYTSGNVSLSRLFGGGLYVIYYGLIKRTGAFPRLNWYLIRFYDWFQQRRGGAPYPRQRGTIPAGQPTPSRPLGLVPGEYVRVRPYREILDTLDARNKNRGMFFDAEEVPFCDKVYRVRSRVERIIDERTGKMIRLQDRNVFLENVWCQARYSDRRMQCPRAIFPIWRETWLERARDPAATNDDAASGAGR